MDPMMIKRIIPNVSVTDAAAGHEFYTEFLGLETAFDLGWIASFRSPAKQAAQVSLVSGDATAHEDFVLSVDVDSVDAAYALAQATGLLPDYDKCQAYIADVHSAFRSGS
jgi:catechol 2,3-dioxygenase-like lactoylglutathione lyase family enzyme